MTPGEFRSGEFVWPAVAQTMFSETPVGMAVATFDGTVVTANPAFCRMLGRPADEIIGHRAHEFVHPDQVALVDSRLAALRTSRTGSISYEARITRPDGTVAWAAVNLSVVTVERDQRLVFGQLIDITTSRLMEQRLALNERRFRTIVEHSTDLVVELDAEGRARYVTPSVRRVLGYGPDAFASAFGPSLVHEADFPTLVEVVERSHAQPGTPLSIRGRLRHADGRWRTLEGTIINLLADPSFEAVVLEARDVTEQLAAQEALRRTNQLLTAIFESSPIPVNVVDTEGRVLLWSPAAERLFGWSAEETVGGPLPFVPEESREESRALLQASLAGGVRGVEVCRRRKDGAPVYLELSTAPLRDAQGRVTGVLSVTVDITARKETEAALRASEERSRTLVEGSFDLITVTAPGGTLTYVSPAARELLGYEPAQLIRTDINELVHPDDRETLRRIGRELRAYRSSTRFRYRARHRDGTWRHFEAVATNLVANPVVGGFLGVSRDVTEQHRQEQLVKGQARVLEAIARDAEPESTLAMIVELVEGQIPDSIGSVLLASDDGTLRAGAGPNVPAPIAGIVAAGITIGPDSMPCGVAAHRREPVIVEDVLADPHWEDIAEVARVWGIRALWSVPIVSRADGTLLGTFAVYHPRPHAPTSADRRVLETCGDLAAIAIERARSRQHLAHQALHDALTGLPNRALFADRLHQALARARRSGEIVGVLFCDLDRFKVVNDSLGHDAGDRLLIEIARRLERGVRPGDTVARLGGDEFTILCENVGGETGATRVAARLASLVSQPISLDGEEVVITASIGIALATGDASPESLVRDADTAMYRAKSRGRNHTVVFDAPMRATARDRLSLENGLRRAVEQHELRLHYQPIVDLHDGRVVAVEALLRWEHPERGLLGPASFLDVAEDSGLIVPVGAWVLEEACRWAAGSIESAAVWVNISARQLSSTELVRTVTQALSDALLAPDRLCLELTENALGQEVLAAAGTLEELHRLGVRIAVDDFGTGHSSLAYLRRLPVDYVKIDRTFVNELGTEDEDSAIVSAVVALGQSLGVGVIAEGIETPVQLRRLRELGCRLGQGFLLARPMSGDDDIAATYLSRVPLPDASAVEGDQFGTRVGDFGVAGQ